MICTVQTGNITNIHKTTEGTDQNIRPCWAWLHDNGFTWKQHQMASIIPLLIDESILKINEFGVTPGWQNLQIHQALGEDSLKQEGLTMFDDPHQRCNGFKDRSWLWWRWPALWCWCMLGMWRKHLEIMPLSMALTGPLLKTNQWVSLLPLPSFVEDGLVTEPCRI